MRWLKVKLAYFIIRRSLVKQEIAPESCADIFPLINCRDRKFSRPFWVSQKLLDWALKIEKEEYERAKLALAQSMASVIENTLKWKATGRQLFVLDSLAGLEETSESNIRQDEAATPD